MRCPVHQTSFAWRSYRSLQVWTGHPVPGIPLELPSFGLVQLGRAGSGGAHPNIPWAIVCGLGLNFIFIVLITLMAVGVSKEVTKMAIIGWSMALGKPVHIIGSLFVIFATFRDPGLSPVPQ